MDTLLLQAATAGPTALRSESIFSAIAVVLLGVLSLYLFLRHEDGRAAVACLAIAGLVATAWYGATGRQRGLASELLASQEKVAELSEAPDERGFTDEARARLVENLADFVGPTAFVLANGEEPETAEYARQIVAILQEAGWSVPPSFGMTYRSVILPGGDEVVSGVVLGVSDEVPEDFAESVQRILRDGGVKIVRGPHWPGTDHPISILVGPKR